MCSKVRGDPHGGLPRPGESAHPRREACSLGALRLRNVQPAIIDGQRLRMPAKTRHNGARVHELTELLELEQVLLQFVLVEPLLELQFEPEVEPLLELEVEPQVVFEFVIVHHPLKHHQGFYQHLSYPY